MNAVVEGQVDVGVVRSVAARSGLEPGDLIVAINDRIITSVDDIHRLLAMPLDNAKFDVTLIRGRRKWDVRLVWS